MHTGTQSKPQTLAQKLIARAAGRAQVQVGDIVTCNVDLAMFHDSSGPRRLKPMLDELGLELWDRTKIVLAMDHYVPEIDDESRRIVQIARDWARDQALPHVYDSQGICHVVTAEHGHIRPGTFCVGGDSHSPTGGAFGAYMFGVGSTEMLGVVTSGKIWLKVPETLMMHWLGTLPSGVVAKDMALFMLARLGMDGGRYQAIEFCGTGVQALSMQERMTLSNMSAEMGAQVGLVAPDAKTLEYLKHVDVHGLDTSRWFSDSGAESECHEFDCATLAPQVAAPHSPVNSASITSYPHTPIQIAYIGACTGAKLDDLRAAAQILRGRRCAPGVKILVAPASMLDQRRAIADGTIAILCEAGASILPTTCGACAGYGASIPENSTVISTTARNYQGRMGARTAQVYLASPYTVAASAVAGRITDPREFLT